MDNLTSREIRKTCVLPGDGEWFVGHISQEQVFAAYAVNVVNEAERLNLQGMKSATQPEDVESYQRATGRSLDSLDTFWYKTRMGLQLRAI